ncbi:cationic amino acid transporter 4-like [Acanthaster planci]|uniref:Cationic amino acid transporter 4-like n=1 Tax=Acanthaster planci TaxID=133434 RepID=A0A8B7XVN8_ACAPL|nr:cationic amino acid transporter 4-like [Acanthaster planci]
MFYTLETVGVILAVVILRYKPTIQSGYMEVGGRDEGYATESSCVLQVNRHQNSLELDGSPEQLQEIHAGDVNAPRDPSTRPSLARKASTDFIQWIREHPTRSVILSLFLHIAFEFLFVGLLTFNLEDLLGPRDPSLIFGILISGSLSLIACCPLLLLPQYKENLIFKVPLMPLLPLIGLLSCVILLLHFDFLAFIQVLIWTCVGIVVYFTYGMKHSVQGARQDGYETN